MHFLVLTILGTVVTTLPTPRTSAPVPLSRRDLSHPCTALTPEKCYYSRSYALPLLSQGKRSMTLKRKMRRRLRRRRRRRRAERQRMEGGRQQGLWWEARRTVKWETRARRRRPWRRAEGRRTDREQRRRQKHIGRGPVGVVLPRYSRTIAHRAPPLFGEQNAA